MKLLREKVYIWIAATFLVAIQPAVADLPIPIISITDPENGAVINSTCVDVQGAFSSKAINQIAVWNASDPMQIPAFIKGNSVDARNIFLASGTNTIIAVALDTAGNMVTNSIVVVGPNNNNATPTFPVQIQLTPADGFAPLPVVFNVQAQVPGKIEKVFYYFDGGNIPDQTNSDLQPVRHTYETEGQYFPVVTIQTTVGRFSNLSGAMGMMAAAFGVGNVLIDVNVQKPPELLSTIQIADPMDIKWNATSNLYVLSGSIATLSEFDENGKLVRSLKGIGANPSGLDVDGNGNVYVVVAGDNQVKKFKPIENSFALDTSFGNGGLIGNKNGSAGSNSGQFNAPFDVKLSSDGQTITVSDSGNQRLEQFDTNGKWKASSGMEGGLQGQLNAPTGLALSDNGADLFITDSGNNRILLTDTLIPFAPNGASGTNGAALGQFNKATHLAANKRALYVADTGNNRIQIFEPVEESEGHSPVPFIPRVSLSNELGLNHPKSITPMNDLLEEKFYIADTGNNRVILVRLPLDNPEKVWKHMIACLKEGDIQGAISDFSISSKDDYLKTYQALPKDDLLSSIKDMEDIQPASIESDHAQYYFQSLVDGKTITFPVEFDKEFGQWKIMQY
jgi:hypothetical protein